MANAVTGLAPTVTKIASDLRHLAYMKEVGEPREVGQIGSSAMVSLFLPFALLRSNSTHINTFPGLQAKPYAV